MVSKERRGKRTTGAPPGAATPSTSSPLRGLSYAGARERLAPATAALDPEAEASWAEVLSGTLVLEQGQSGPAVRLLQQKLATSGHDIRPSGVFGPTTAALIAAFQGAHGLEPSGRVDAATAIALG